MARRALKVKVTGKGRVTSKANAIGLTSIEDSLFFLVAFCCSFGAAVGWRPDAVQWSASLVAPTKLIIIGLG